MNGSPGATVLRDGAADRPGPVSAVPSPDPRAQVTDRAQAAQSDHERRVIMRAAHRLIGRGGRGTTPIEDILRAAGVNRRIFYRHFPSKDALILAMQQDAANLVEGALLAAVTAADDGRAAVIAWIGELLLIGWDPRAAREGWTFLTPEAGLVDGLSEALEDTYDRHRRILVDALARARADGTMPVAEPEREAFAIQAVVLRCLERRARGRIDRPYAAVLDEITAQFVPPAPTSARR
ncbi:MAG: TetR/AcrR family transcriptional regulator [Frankia sp.]|nr:TetR/AcrR family transcriptional regulator [Frankia sp.]